jgi:hypothetical protein
MLSVARGLLDGEQELLGKTFDPTQAADGRDPGVAVAVDFGGGDPG